MTDLLVVVDHVSKMITTTIMGLPNAHGIMGEVDIAVIAEEFGHGCDLLMILREGIKLLILVGLFASDIQASRFEVID